MRLQVQLYTTAGCHLCEQAQSMLQYLTQQSMPFAGKLDLIPVEISESEALVEEYGVRIPVLGINGQELGWPFEMETLVAWLSEQITD